MHETVDRVAAEPRRSRMAMRDRVGVGQVWRRRRDRSCWRVVQAWRTDRTVMLEPAVGTGGRILVGFDELRRKWILVAGGC